jgi:hypothetical protein
MISFVLVWRNSNVSNVAIPFFGIRLERIVADIDYGPAPRGSLVRSHHATSITRVGLGQNWNRAPCLLPLTRSPYSFLSVSPVGGTVKQISSALLARALYLIVPSSNYSSTSHTTLLPTSVAPPRPSSTLLYRWNLVVEAACLATVKSLLATAGRPRPGCCQARARHGLGCHDAPPCAPLVTTAAGTGSSSRSPPPVLHPCPWRREGVNHK